MKLKIKKNQWTIKLTQEEYNQLRQNKKLAESFPLADHRFNVALLIDLEDQDIQDNQTQYNHELGYVHSCNLDIKLTITKQGILELVQAPFDGIEITYLNHQYQIMVDKGGC